MMTRVGTMLGFFFTEAPIPSWEDAKLADTKRFGAFLRRMRDRACTSPRPSSRPGSSRGAHGDVEIDETIRQPLAGAGLGSPRLSADHALPLRPHEGAPRHALLPAGGRGRRAASSEARAVPARARHRDARARARRPEVGAPRPRPSRADAGLGALRSLRGAAGAETCRGAAPRPPGSSVRCSRRGSTARRLLVPDASVTWNLTAIPAAIRIVRREGIDARRDDVASRLHPLRRRCRQAGYGRALARGPARPARGQPASPCRHRCHPRSPGGESAAGTARRAPRGRDLVRLGRGRGGGARPRSTRDRPHDCERLRLRRLRGPRVPPGSTPFRITHAGSFFGKRDPRPFLQALRDSGVDAVARFVGDFRSSDREWAETLGLGDRLELIPYAPRPRVASPPARLRGAAPAHPGRGWTRQGRAVRKGLRVPRRGQARFSPSSRRTALRPRSSARRTCRRGGRRRTTFEGIAAALRELHARSASTAASPAAELSEGDRERLSRRARAEETAGLLPRDRLERAPGMRHCPTPVGAAREVSSERASMSFDVTAADSVRTLAPEAR